MSWPADGRERFKASSIGAGWGVVDGIPAPYGYVYDRAFCHRIVSALPANTQGVALARAEAEAAYLNADHAREPRPAHVPRIPSDHGMTGYQRGECRCEVCTAANAAASRAHRAKTKAPTA